MGKFAHRKINYDNARNIARNMAMATVKAPMSREEYEAKQIQFTQYIEDRCSYSKFRDGGFIFSNLAIPMQAWDELDHETQLQWGKSNRDYYRSPFKNVLKIPNSAFGFDEPIQIADDKEINIHFELDVGNADGLDWYFIGKGQAERFRHEPLSMFIDEDRLARHEVKPFDVKKDFPSLHKEMVDALLPWGIYRKDLDTLEHQITDQIVDRTTKQVMDTWEESKGFIYENYGYTDDDSSSMIAPYSELVSKCGINLLTAQ